MKHLAIAITLMLPAALRADTSNAMVAGVIDAHILPRFEALAAQTQTLSDAAMADCDPASPPLRAAYAGAFDAWVSASHLRFGPTETDDRAFALAFWPDSRGATPRALAGLIAAQDPIATSADYADVSIAARGFYALEFLLYDDALMNAGDPAYHCALVQTISADIADTSQQIITAWISDYSAKMREPGPEGLYRSDAEVLQELLKALSTGLQFTAETRLGRPLGSFDRPRPNRAEARRSGRSARHVILSLTALRDLAAHLAGDDAELAEALDHSFEKSLSRLADLDDPIFAGVADPQSRLKVEVIQQSVEAIRTVVRDQLGPTMGVAPGFNSLDGD